MKTSSNWAAIKAEYLSGGSSYKTLAAKHGVSLNTLEKRARREAWAESRRQVGGKLAAEMPEIIAAKLLEETSAVAHRHFDLWGEALMLAEAMIARLSSVKDLREWALAVKAATEGQRLAAGMPDPNRKPLNDPGRTLDDDLKGSGVLVLPMKDDEPQSPDEEGI